MDFASGGFDGEVGGEDGGSFEFGRAGDGVADSGPYHFVVLLFVSLLVKKCFCYIGECDTATFDVIIIMVLRLGVDVDASTILLFFLFIG